jgi:hypothetical protein
MKFLLDRFKRLLKWSAIFVMIAQIIALVDSKVGLTTLHKYGDYVRDGLGGIPIYAQIIIIMLILLFIIFFDQKGD